MVELGVAIGGPYAVLGELARQVEARGFDGIWVSETTQDSLVQSAVVIDATDRVRVGTNITLAFPRSPTNTAMAAWDLDELSGGRFTLGLGSQVRRIIEDRFSAPFDPPAPRMAEYLQALRAVWSTARGTHTTFEGRYYTIRLPGFHGRPQPERRMPPVFLAAVGPHMTRVAAKYADGLLGHPFTSLRYLEDRLLPGLVATLEQAGRRRDEFTLAQGLIVCIADDRAVAIREAKQQIAFYGTTPNYRHVFDSHGEGHLTDVLRQTWKRTGADPAAMVDAVPDEAVERYAVAGTPAEVRDRLDAYARLVDHLILGGAWWQVPVQRQAENLWAILETFTRR